MIAVKELHQKRGPGNTCLSSLLSGKMGSITEPINNSKGCGGVMRVSPVGLVFEQQTAFELASECAALTHGHPSGYLSAGVLAYVISSLIRGIGLEEAVNNSLQILKTYPGHEECTAAVQMAIDLSQDDIEPSIAISRIGEGWVGEEALAIAVYCALKFTHDFRQALVASVNHSGDSDSTGAITGNILGAYLGLGHIPEVWVERVQLKDVIMQIADDLLIGFKDSKEWWNRYPGY